MVIEDNDFQLARRLRAVSGWCAGLLALGGAVVLLGWLLRVEMLKRVLPGLVAMNPVTALGFIFAGASFVCFLWSEKNPPLKSRSGRMLAGVLVVIGALKLSEYMFGWHFGFDQVLFRKQMQDAATGFRSQIAPNTAFNFLLGGIALGLLNSPGPRLARWAQGVSLILAFVSLVPLVGYLYRASYLYSIGSHIPMALHTAALFCLLASGLLLAQTDFGVVALFTSKTSGGVIARRLLPFAFGVPVALGGLRMWGEKKGLYPTEFDITIMVVGSFAIFTALIWWNAVLLNRTDGKRREAEGNLKKAHGELEIRVQERTAMLKDLNHALLERITELQGAEEKIREQAELLNEAQDAILVLDIQRRIVFWNKGAEHLYGWPAEEAAGKNADALLFKDAPGLPEGCREILQTGKWTGELQHITRAGQPVTVESRWTRVNDEKGAPKCVLIINTDITEKKNYETQLLRSQRMEGIGALAGGIAHDLNNALAPIVMGAQLLRKTNVEGDREKLLDIISGSAQRGTEMVRQILSFARGSQGQTGPVQLQHVVAEMAKIVRDTFPKSISISVNRGKNLWNVQGDVTELHQVLLNLCVNARDAMPQGGQLTLTAENVEMDGKTPPARTDVPPGPYVVVTVADTGTGISPEVLPRIFEPFFTTKKSDKGTGLGLSTLAAIVKRHNGFIQVRSEVGKGAEFKVYLPARKSVGSARSKPSEPALPTGNGELILVMNDEAAVRELGRTTLENYGYRVVTAPNGIQGINCFEDHRNEIKLVLTDTDMPFMDGIVAVRAIQRLRPDIQVIIASGAGGDSEHLRSLDTTHLTSLAKPYTVEALLKAVAQAMNAASAPA